jgi:hypothetical protein
MYGILAASSSDTNLRMTASGDSAEAIEFDEQLVLDAAFVELGVCGADPGDCELSLDLTHQACGSEALLAAQPALSLGLRALSIRRGI